MYMNNFRFKVKVANIIQSLLAGFSPEYPLLKKVSREHFITVLHVIFLPSSTRNEHLNADVLH